MSIWRSLPPTVRRCFSEGDDQINFGNPASGALGLDAAGSYEDASQYAALGGDDDVYLPLTQALIRADADLAGDDLTRSFDLGAGDDALFGSLLDDDIVGGDGRDWITGLEGNDTISGGVAGTSSKAVPATTCWTAARR